MNRQEHLMINDAGYSGPSPASPWASLSSALTSRSGVGLIAKTVGNVAGTMATAQASEAQAGAYDFKADMYGMDADRLTGMALISAGVQREIIKAQTTEAKVASADKWLWRYGAVRSRYAAAGVDVSTGTPLQAYGELLEAMEQEERLIDLNASIKRFNQVFIPTQQAKMETVKTEAAEDLSRAEGEMHREHARMQRTVGLISAGAEALDVIGGLL